MKAALKGAREVWETIKCRTQRQARGKQRQKLRSGSFRNAPILWILEFLIEKEDVCEISLNDIHRSDEQLERDMPLLRCVCACFMAFHGQRLSSLYNLTLEELQSATFTQGRYVVRIKRHKNCKTHGPACVALKAHQFHLIEAMANAHGENGRVFPIKPTGHASKELFAPLNAYISNKCHSSPDITCNLIRKTIESNKFLVQNAESHAAAQISSYLCHGKTATDLHYGFKTDAAVVAEALSVESVLACLAALDLVRERRISLPGPQSNY